MKSFLAAILFVVIAAIGSSMVLDTYQQTAAEKFTTSGVRLGTDG